MSKHLRCPPPPPPPPNPHILTGCGTMWRHARAAGARVRAGAGPDGCPYAQSSGSAHQRPPSGSSSLPMAHVTRSGSGGGCGCQAASNTEKAPTPTASNYSLARAGPREQQHKMAPRAPGPRMGQTRPNMTQTVPSPLVVPARGVESTSTTSDVPTKPNMGRSVGHSGPFCPPQTPFVAHCAPRP